MANVAGRRRWGGSRVDVRGPWETVISGEFAEAEGDGVGAVLGVVQGLGVWGEGVAVGRDAGLAEFFDGEAGIAEGFPIDAEWTVVPEELGSEMGPGRIALLRFEEVAVRPFVGDVNALAGVGAALRETRVRKNGDDDAGGLEDAVGGAECGVKVGGVHEHVVEEDGVEGGVGDGGEDAAIIDAEVEAGVGFAGDADHFGGEVCAADGGAGAVELGGEVAGAAADVEDGEVFGWAEEFVEYGVGVEAAVAVAVVADLGAPVCGLLVPTAADVCERVFHVWDYDGVAERGQINDACLWRALRGRGMVRGGGLW